jgi:hypothetical protein
MKLIPRMSPSSNWHEVISAKIEIGQHNQLNWVNIVIKDASGNKAVFTLYPDGDQEHSKPEALRIVSELRASAEATLIKVRNN